MPTNPVLVSIFEKYGTSETRESYVKQSVRHEVQRHAKKVEVDRTQWFNNYTLPKVSVLARLSPFDRAALIAHFRAKELRKIADARHKGDDYQAGLAIKRLDRVNEIAKSFAEVTASARWLAA